MIHAYYFDMQCFNSNGFSSILYNTCTYLYCLVFIMCGNTRDITIVASWAHLWDHRVNHYGLNLLARLSGGGSRTLASNRGSQPIYEVYNLFRPFYQRRHPVQNHFFFGGGGGGLLGQIARMSFIFSLCLWPLSGTVVSV